MATALTAQTVATKPTAAVATPSIQGLSITSDVAAKMIRFELGKAQVYQLYDEYDMNEIIIGEPVYTVDCYGVMCLSDLGKRLNVDYMICGSIDKLSDRIVINIKVIDVKKRTVAQSLQKEYEYLPNELQRMIEAIICAMFGLPFDPIILQNLEYAKEPIINEDYERINNTGPRMGCAYMFGGLQEFATRPESQGGLDIVPITSMLGYQVEFQYIGTENFSALIEWIVNVSGMDQGRFIPSVDVLNGFRIGSAGWEIGFGPGFSVATRSNGFFDTDNTFGKGVNAYFSQADWNEYSTIHYGEELPVTNFNPDYAFTKEYDARGQSTISTSWIFAVGKTCQIGSLNIPINGFYTIMDNGSYAGVSFGFNVVKP
jgi:hypothetical protein